MEITTTMKKTTKKRTLKGLDSGSNFKKELEPSFSDDTTPEQISESMKWYMTFSDATQSKKWLVEYMKNIGYEKDDIEKFKNFNWNKSGLEIQKGEILNLKYAGFISRMYLRGLVIIPDQFKIRLDEAIKFCIKMGNVEKPIDYLESKFSIQDHITFQVNTLCSELDDALEDFYDSGFKKKLNVYDWLRTKNVKSLIAKRVGDNFKSLFQEIQDINYDEDLKEAYSNFKKNEIKKYSNFVHSIIEDCDKYSSNQIKQRKPRKKKPVTVEKQISKLNYKQEDVDYRIKSVDPSQIIGSSVLWVFNTKYRKLGSYVSEKPAGLSIKGSSIIGFDEVKSIQKTLRKPDQLLNVILSGPKVSIRKNFDLISSKEQKLTGRINKDVILMRVIK